MTDRDLQKAMSDIRDDFILEASPDQVGAKPVPIWRRHSFRVVSGLAAACLVLVIGINTFLIRHPESGKTSVPVTDMDTVSDHFEEKAQEDVPLNSYEAPAAPDSASPNAGAGMDISSPNVEMEMASPDADAEMEIAYESEEALSEAASEAESETEISNK